MSQINNYDDRIRLLVEIDSLVLKINRTILDSSSVGYLENFLSHTLGTIPPANKMLVYGIQNDLNISTTSALRILLENWANINYVVSSKNKKLDYAKKIEKSALGYAHALEDMLSDPSLGMTPIDNVPRWTGSGLKRRIGMLGDGAKFQYEFLCRYVHSDVWSVVNDYLIDRERFQKVMLGWGLEFICETLKLITKEEAGRPFKSKASDISHRMRLLVVQSDDL